MVNIHLPISKSIANRLLLLQAIHGDPLMRVSSDMPDDILVLHDALEQLQEYKKGEKYHSEDFNNVSVSSYALYISHGFHVFKNEIQAVKSAYGLRKMFKENYTVFVCIIPKGARYYEGMFSSMGMLCAEDLILKQESDIQ